MMLAAGYGWQIGTLVGLLVASGFFSGSETALFTLKHSDRRAFAASASLSARWATGLLARPQRLLTTLLLGNMIVNVAFSASAAMLVLDIRAAGAAAWVVVLASLAPLLAVILFGEVTPKMLALTVSRRWALLAAMPIRVLQWAAGPVLWGLENGFIWPLTRVLAPTRAKTGEITPEQLAALMALSSKRGMIDPAAGDLLGEIVELADIRAGDVMVPRVDMVAMDLDAGAAAIVERFRETRLKKIPVYRGDLDNLLGVIHTKQLMLSPETPLDEMVHPVTILPVAATLEKVLLQFRRAGSQLAIVVDEYGGTAGLVTLEDVLEEIVGDIHAPNDPDAPPAIVKISETEYELAGHCSIRDWADAFALPPEDLPRISTLGGLVTARLGRIPRVEDVVHYRNLILTVTAMHRRRVAAIRVQLQSREGGA